MIRRNIADAKAVAGLNAETIGAQQAEIRRLEGLIARLVERGSNLIYPTTPVLLTEAWWQIVKASRPAAKENAK